MITLARVPYLASDHALMMSNCDKKEHTCGQQPNDTRPAGQSFGKLRHFNPFECLHKSNQVDESVHEQQ